MTSVTSWALALIAATATEDTPGVTAITGRPAGLSRRSVLRAGADSVAIREVDEGAISVTLALTTGPPCRCNLAELAETVRHNVVTAITDLTQLSVAAVDVNIDDLDVPPK